MALENSCAISFLPPWSDGENPSDDKSVTILLFLSCSYRFSFRGRWEQRKVSPEKRGIWEE